MLRLRFGLAGFDIIYACQDFEFDRKEGAIIPFLPASGSQGALASRATSISLRQSALSLLFWMTDLSWMLSGRHIDCSRLS